MLADSSDSDEANQSKAKKRGNNKQSKKEVDLRSEDLKMYKNVFQTLAKQNNK